MDSKSRREDILVRLIESVTPIKGTDFAKLYNVTRQIIVKDIAILRAKGNKIIATPDGYIITSEDNRVRTMYKTNMSSNILVSVITSKNITDLFSRVQAISKILSTDKEILSDI